MMRFLILLIDYWTPRDAALTLLTVIATAYSLVNLRETPFGVAVTLVLLLVQGALWYGTGRKHQVREDAQQIEAARDIQRETRQMLHEAFLFEIWAVDMRTDEHKQILIQTRVSTN
jgi:hypothetical protein